MYMYTYSRAHAAKAYSRDRMSGVRLTTSECNFGCKRERERYGAR